MFFRRITKVLLEPSEGMLEVTKNPDTWRVLLFNFAIVVSFSIMSAVHYAHLAPSGFQRFYWITSVLLPVGGFLLKVTGIAVGLVFLSSFLLGNATFRQMFTVAAYAYIPVNLFSYGLSVLLITNNWTTSIQPTSLAVLDIWIPESMHSIVGLLSLLDPFKAWAMLLVGIGFSRATKCAAKKGIAAIFVSWSALVALQYGVIFR